MPHIEVIIPGSEIETLTILHDNKKKIRFVLHKIFNYPMDKIALIPRILTGQEEYLADNILQMELKIDIGLQPKMDIDDMYAKIFRDTLLKNCPEFGKIKFAIWIREMQSNGFAEHTP